MSLKASELPDDVKQQLLRRFRDQMGPTEYDRWLHDFGEDSVIDFALATMGPPPPPPRRPISERIKSSLSAMLPIIIFFGPWLGLVLILGPDAGTSVFWGLLLLLRLFFWLYEQTQEFGLGGIAVFVLVLLFLVGIGYLLWIGGAWLVGGVSQWWAWLGGHF